LRKACQKYNAQAQHWTLETSLKAKDFFTVPPSQIEHRLVVAPGIVLVMCDFDIFLGPASSGLRPAGWPRRGREVIEQR
jgi:hypothetical protein